MLYPDTLIVSLDLKTLSNRAPTAAIATIGMAAIELSAPHSVLASYYARVARDSALKIGQASEDTLAWWAEQTPEARAEIEHGDTNILTALCELTNQIISLTAGRDTSRVMIVARAPSFDCAILDHHYRAIHLRTPWQYWQERDHRSLEDALRTALELQGLSTKSYRDAMPVAHHAMRDAVAQAQYLGQLYVQLRRDQHEKEAA